MPRAERRHSRVNRLLATVAIVGVLVGGGVYGYGLVADRANPSADPPVGIPGLPAPTRFVATNGDDTGDCTNPGSPCATFGRAYDQANQGEVVQVAAGSYPSQTISGSPKGNPDADEDDVIFVPDGAVTVEHILFHNPHIEVRDMTVTKWSVDYRREVESMRGSDVTVRNVDSGVADISSAWNVRVLGGDIGPNEGVPSDNYPWPQDGLIVNDFGEGRHPSHILIDGVTFHDITRPTPDSHSDCLQFTSGVDVTIRNSRFYNCADVNIIPKNDQGPIQDFLVENNMFGAVVNGPPSINLFDTPSQLCGDFTVRYNAFENQGLRADGDTAECNLVVVGNIFRSVNCTNYAADVAEYNVVETGPIPCLNETNYRVPDSDVGYVNRSNTSALDLRLRRGSEAIGRGHPEIYPESDFFGTARVAEPAPAAGAHERG